MTKDVNDINMRDMVGFRVRKKVRKRLKRLAWEDRRTLSSFVENLLTDYVAGELRYPDQETEDDVPLSKRADKAAWELQNIISEAQSFEFEVDPGGHIDQASSDLEDFAEALRDAGANDGTWEQDRDEDD